MGIEVGQRASNQGELPGRNGKLKGAMIDLFKRGRQEQELSVEAVELSALSG